MADLGGLLSYWPQRDDPAEAVFQAPAHDLLVRAQAIAVAEGI